MDTGNREGWEGPIWVILENQMRESDDVREEGREGQKRMSINK